MRQLLAQDVEGKIAYAAIRERFEQVNPSRYGYSMPQWVPDFTALNQLFVETVGLSISAENPHPHILELGAGTGRVTQLLLNTFSEDYPLSLSKHLALLTEAGFSATDVVWRSGIFALYVGVKS